MSNYIRQVDFREKSINEEVVDGSEFDLEFDAIATASATKANKVTSPTSGNIVSLTATGDLKDSTQNPTGQTTVNLKKNDSILPVEIIHNITATAGGVWTTITSTTLANANAVACRLVASYRTNNDVDLYVRKKGSSASQDNSTLIIRARETLSSSFTHGISFSVGVDETGSFEYALVDSAPVTLTIQLLEYTA